MLLSVYSKRPHCINTARANVGNERFRVHPQKLPFLLIANITCSGYLKAEKNTFVAKDNNDKIKINALNKHLDETFHAGYIKALPTEAFAMLQLPYDTAAYPSTDRVPKETK